MRLEPQSLEVTIDETLSPKPLGLIIREAEEGQALTLGHLNEQHKDHALKSVTLVIAELFEAYGTEYKGVVRTIQKISTLILHRFSYWTLSDLSNFVYNARFGEYGKIYGRLTEANVLSWLKQYDNERNENTIRYKHKRYNEEYLTREVATPEQVRAMVSQYFQEAEQRKQEAERQKQAQAPTKPGMPKRIKEAITEIASTQEASPTPLQGYDFADDAEQEQGTHEELQD